MIDKRSSGRRELAPHGSPAGFDQGCRSAAMCPHHRSEELLTCTEAAQRRRGDFAVAKLPAYQPLPRALDIPHRDASPSRREASHKEPVHGTLYGYRRGCHDRSSCPNWRAGKVTCPDARRAYFAEYHGRRLAGDGTPVAHGTSAGYLAGCRDAATCPGDAAGTTCSQARANYRVRRARQEGVGPPPETVPSAAAFDALTKLTQSGYSLRQIARAAGLSRTTVAKVAAGRNDIILKETSVRLTLLVARLGYRDNVHRRIQSSRTTAELGP